MLQGLDDVWEKGTVQRNIGEDVVKFWKGLGHGKNSVLEIVYPSAVGHLIWKNGEVWLALLKDTKSPTIKSQTDGTSLNSIARLDGSLVDLAPKPNALGLEKKKWYFTVRALMKTIPKEK
ncbi:hypothetical protein K504DRAFT_448900 [Pleomassaria siparia CBS 279.74]|uniref:Uncharacterized protein n=1 Tax=Pleomassaria siparia CBS 279.74 TaxID=1314801 RepID=A0A6G1JYU6_9PLEO|nr:hypothetical protein K504DRAFT_448900 [Pleomassaria siparia CBS 279.74]